VRHVRLTRLRAYDIAANIASLLLLACLLVAVEAAMAAEIRLPPPPPMGTQVPGWVTSAIVIAFTPVTAGAVALLLWHNSAWLTGALPQATAASQALRHARQQVADQAAQLQASRVRVVAAADAERRRIQRDLHDGAQQSLIAAAVTARLARQHWETNPARAAELLDQLRADLDQAATGLRRLAHGIYPPALTDLGLPAALTAAAARCPRPVTVHADSTTRYPPAVEAAIYFCCLEALQNAAKHAGDHARITVTLRHDTSGLVCEITDDGTGITSTGTGAGLANMADRIAAVGGQLRIHSAPGCGTTIRASAPARPVASPGTAGTTGSVTRPGPREGGAGTTENTLGCTLPPASGQQG
jgi:signal transduction histidine kinase